MKLVVFSQMPTRTVKVPEQMKPIFERAEEVVSNYFKLRNDDPTKGTIEISGDRYVMIRAPALSVEFFDLVEGLFGKGRENEAREFALNLLFDLAHAIGKSDAHNFQDKMHLQEPLQKLSAGPVHFSHSGWAFVDIFPESHPSADEDYMLIYDHPYSFESDAWKRYGRTSNFPVCIMNAGYSSGWCEESFGVTLVASEILCQAKGDDCCRFIMAPPSKIEGHIERYLKERPEVAPRAGGYSIPDFFARKRLEEQLRRRIDEVAQLNVDLVNSAKLAAMGRMGASIAHQLNSPLCGARLHIDALLDEPGLAPSAVDKLNGLRSSINAMKSVIDCMLSLAMVNIRGQPEADTVDINAALRGIIDFTSLECIKRGITVSAALDPGVNPLQARRGDLDQVFLNLVNNSLDAMETGGTLSITSRQMDDGIEIRIADTGHGIPRENLEKIFEPFFTTRKKQRGLGLGLSISREIAERYGGSIKVARDRPMGTEFVVKFPQGSPSAEKNNRP